MAIKLRSKMKNFTILVMIFFITNLKAQNNIDKVKIGKYDYNIYNKEYHEYEINKMNLSFLISLNDKEYNLGKYLSYNLENSPILLGIGQLKINKINKTITCTYKNLIKDNYEKYDSILYINKQKADGSFYKISIVEYHNGIKNIIK